MNLLRLFYCIISVNASIVALLAIFVNLIKLRERNDEVSARLSRKQAKYVQPNAIKNN
jgi:hypothetical protein